MLEQGPLVGVKVVSFGHYVAGPLAAMLLADQGAEVVRVGRSGSEGLADRCASIFDRPGQVVHRLDLKDRDDRARAAALIESADVVVENFRPGVMDRLGLGPCSMRDRDERLIYCSLPGFGRDDPRSGLQAWEGVVLAAAGCFATGTTPMVAGEWWVTTGRAFTPLLLGSHFAGMQAAMGIAAALLARERLGTGQVVEIALFDALFEAIGARALHYERNAPSGFLFGSGLYRGSDGRYVNLVTVWLRHLEWFLRASGKVDWVEDGFVSYDNLMRHVSTRDELKSRLVALFATRSAREWEQLGRAAGVPIAAVRTRAE